MCNICVNFLSIFSQLNNLNHNATKNCFTSSMRLLSRIITLMYKYLGLFLQHFTIMCEIYLYV